MHGVRMSFVMNIITQSTTISLFHVKPRLPCICRAVYTFAVVKIGDHRFLTCFNFVEALTVLLRNLECSTKRC